MWNRRCINALRWLQQLYEDFKWVLFFPLLVVYSFHMAFYFGFLVGMWTQSVLGVIFGILLWISPWLIPLIRDRDRQARDGLKGRDGFYRKAEKEHAKTKHI